MDMKVSSVQHPAGVGLVLMFPITIIHHRPPSSALGVYSASLAHCFGQGISC